MGKQESADERAVRAARPRTPTSSASATSCAAAIAPTIARPSRRTENAAAAPTPIIASGQSRAATSTKAFLAASRSSATSTTPVTARNGHSDWINSVHPRSSGVIVTATVPTSAGTVPSRRFANANHDQANTVAQITGTIVRRSTSGPRTATNGERMIGKPHGYSGGLNAAPRDWSTVNRFSSVT